MTNGRCVILKELTDNAIDAAEESGIAPTVRIEVTDRAIIIGDNGPGIPDETVVGILDFSVRVSSREAYVSPTRGAQGNALKTIVAMPFALDGSKGETLIESRKAAHRITFKADHVRQQPKIDHVRDRSNVKTGTRITVRWPRCACSKLVKAKPHFLQMAENFGWINPHLTLSADLERQTLLSITRPPIRTGRNGVRTIRPHRIGTTKQAAAIDGCIHCTRSGSRPGAAHRP